MFQIEETAPATVSLDGRLDAAQSEYADNFLLQLSPGSLTLDLSGLEYISSAGLGVLLKTHKRLSAEGHVMTLSGVGTHLADIFRYSGFDRLFTIARAE